MSATVESRRTSTRIPESRVLLVAAFGAFLAFLDATVVNVAFPDIRASFPGATVGDLSWVLNAYNIVFASFLIVCGRLTDLVGRKRMFVLGTAVFTLASLWCSVSGSLEMLVVARMVQALGAAVLVPASLAIVVEAFPEDRRSHAVGLWGASAALAAGLGPPIGGALVELGGWRLAFLVNLPIGIAAILSIRRNLVESRAPGRRTLPDLRGALLLALALSALTLGIVQGNDWGWTSARVLGAFAAAIACGAGFAVSSHVHPRPLVDSSLLAIRAFSVGNGVTIIAGMGFYAYMLTNILWLQYVWGYSIFAAGLALVPGALVAAVVAGVLGDVAQRRGYRFVIVPGAIVWCAAYLWYAMVVDTEPAFLTQWLPGQLLSGIGVGATLPVLGSAALAAVPGGRFATASAVVSSARQLGGVLGISILVVIIGTPTPLNAASVLRDGWLFCAGCFAVAAVAALLLGTVRPAAEDAGLEPRAIDVHVPAEPVVEDAEALLAEPVRDSTSFVDRLPEEARRRIEAAGTRLDLPAGDWLCRRGEVADSLYLLRSGRLEVVVDDVVVRELGPGAAVGELALLTSGVRTASVRARRDSRLLALPREHFLDVLEHAPATAVAVATALAEQLATARPAQVSDGGPARLVAVVGVGASSPAAAVADALAVRLAPHCDVHVSRAADAEELARAERLHDRVLLVAEHGDGPWWQACVRQSDRLVLVARADEPPPERWEGRPGVDLVLVGPDADASTVTRWIELVRPWQVVSVAAPEDGIDALARAIAGRSLGLVLAGGGARAMAHIGVLQELEDAGIVVDRVAGTSFGAVVAAVYALGHDARTVQEIHHEAFVRGNPFGDYTIPSKALTKGRRTPERLRHFLGEDTQVESLPRLFRCVSVDLNARRQVVHRSGPLWQAVAASARLPILTPPLQVDGRMLVDGCVLDNLPVDTLLERPEGPVVAVNIGAGERVRRPGEPPRIPALGDALLRLMMIGGQGTAQHARERGAYVITPPTLGVGMLEFHQLDRLVEAGRTAARALLDATGGDLWR